MNRRKIAIASFALATLVTLSACSNPVTENGDGFIITLKDQTGKDVGYTADQLFGQYRQNEFGVSKFVESLTELVIRNQINQEDTATQALKAEILRKADISVDGVKETARTNASTNGTNYNDELQTLLDSYNVEDLEELKDYFAYRTMKQEVEDRYFKDNKENFLVGDNFGPGYLTERLPYHVKHILVKVSAAGSDLYNGKISEAEAKKLSAVANRLAIQRNGETFGEVAREMSEDGSKEQFGDLGIMSKATSFVNEFKLGIYAYEAVFNQTPEVIAKRDQLNVPETAVDFFDELGLATIPFHAFDSLNQFANVTKDLNGNPVNNNDALYYPRNVIFNEFFNRHNIAVVTPESRGGGDYIYPGFREVPELGNEKVLTDENGKVILVVRAGTGSGDSGYQGIHFIVVERSALIDIQNGVALEDYYTTEIPGTPNYPQANGQDLVTFVNYNVTTTANYKTRAETVTSEIRNFDRFFNFRMLSQLIDEQAVTFVDEDLEDAVLNYMDVSRRSASFDQALQEANTWNTFIEFLEYQEFQRQRLIDLDCAYNYQDPTSALFTVGGICYVQK
ncbi:MAG: foldase protein PrsA [Bacilli bacterium]